MPANSLATLGQDTKADLLKTMNSSPYGNMPKDEELPLPETPRELSAESIPRSTSSKDTEEL